MSVTHAKRRSAKLAEFTLHMESVRARLEARCADAVLEHGVPAVMVAVDELAAIALDLGKSSIHLRELHAKLLAEEDRECVF